MSSATLPSNSDEGVDETKQVSARRNGHSPVAAELLDFVWPGLGHAYARHLSLAVLFALPPTVVVLACLVLAIRDPSALALSLLAPGVALVAIGLIAGHGLWRVAAILDSWRITRRERPASRSHALAIAVLLSIVVIALHTAAGTYVQSFSSAGSRIFTGDRPQGPNEVDDILGGQPVASSQGGQSGIPGDTNGDGVVNGFDIVLGDTNGDGLVDSNDDPQTNTDDEVPDDPDGSPVPGPSFDPTATPPPFDSGDVPVGALPTSGPINVLFIGLDSGDGRNHSLSDSLIVASYYPERDALTMISFPRDTGALPLYKGGVYPNRINTFLGYANGNTALFPEGPVSALMTELGYLLGSPIEFYAATNLDGLPLAVDAVGGIDVTLEKAIDDPSMPLFMPTGNYHLDGTQALAFARSRHGPNNNDFIRARRQQQVLAALAHRLKDPIVSINLPTVMNDLAAVVRTNVPRDQVGLLLSLVQRASDASTEHIVLSPPGGYAAVIPAAEVNGRYMTQLNIAAVELLSLRIFGDYSRYQ